MQPQGLRFTVGSVHWCHTDKHGALWAGTDESGCGRHLSFFLFSSTQREATAFSDTGEKRTRFFPGLLSIFTQVALSPVQGTSPGSPQNLPLWTQSAEARKKEGGTKPRAQTEDGESHHPNRNGNQSCLPPAAPARGSRDQLSHESFLKAMGFGELMCLEGSVNPLPTPHLTGQ